MPTKKTEVIHAKGIDIGVYTMDYSNDYVSLTDIARFRSIKPTITIHNWLRNRDVVEFLGLWETLHNPEFKVIEFDNFKLDAGSNATLQQLLVLANMESYNAIMIEENFPQGLRLEKLREATITQLKAIQQLNTEHLPVLPESVGDEKD